MTTPMRPTMLCVAICALASIMLLPLHVTTSAQVNSGSHVSPDSHHSHDPEVNAPRHDPADQRVEAGNPPEQDDHSLPRRVHVFLPDKNQMATLYADGSALETEWEMLWRPICNSDPNALTHEDLLALIQRHNDAFQAGIVNPGEADQGVAGGNFNIVFNLDSSVPAEAADALAEVEAYLESKFNDPITIAVNVSFDILPFGVLGATSAAYTKASWSVSRNALKSDMDDTDNVQNYLPSGSTMPVRWNGGSNTVSQETRVFWTRANFRAAVGSISGSAGNLIFNDNFSWDFDPSDGVVGYSFEDVVVHEMGHVLGFSSGADFRIKDIEALDIFRFQRSNGGFDYNPDSLNEFKVRPRLVSFNSPNNDHVCDTITQESRMSDGNPYQAGHFREQSTNIGLMDPALTAGETHFPSFFSTPDLRFFDAIGYDR